MKNQVFVGNLPHHLTREELKAHFQAFGPITEILIILDRETQHSRGFGFITFSTESAAQQAIQTMDKQLIDGRPVRVMLARPFIKRAAPEATAPVTATAE